MRIAIAALLIGVVLCGPVHAQQTAPENQPAFPPPATMVPPPAAAPQASAPIADPERLAIARTLMEATRSDQAVTQIMKQFSANLGGAMLRVNPDKQQIIQQLINEDLIPIFLAHMHEMNENAAVVYAREFSLDELKGIIAFYQSPVGQKYLQTVPKLVGETMQANRALIIGIAAEATAKLKNDLQKNKMQVPKEMGI